MTTTIFKTTDFKIGDVVAYDAGEKFVYILELLSDHFGIFNYQIVLDATKMGRDGHAAKLWSVSAAELAHRVVAKW